MADLTEEQKKAIADSIALARANMGEQRQVEVLVSGGGVVTSNNPLFKVIKVEGS